MKKYFTPELDLIVVPSDIVMNPTSPVDVEINVGIEQ